MHGGMHVEDGENNDLEWMVEEAWEEEFGEEEAWEEAWEEAVARRAGWEAMAENVDTFWMKTDPVPAPHGAPAVMGSVEVTRMGFENRVVEVEVMINFNGMAEGESGTVGLVAVCGAGTLAVELERATAVPTAESCQTHVRLVGTVPAGLHGGSPFTLAIEASVSGGADGGGDMFILPGVMRVTSFTWE